LRKKLSRDSLCDGGNCVQDHYSLPADHDRIGYARRHDFHSDWFISKRGDIHASSQITLNTTAGTVTALSIGVSAPDPAAFTLASGAILIPQPSGQEISIGGTFPFLNLFLPVSTLVGYSGGPLCAGTGAGCSNPTFLAPLGNRDNLISGSLAPVGVPEPSILFTMLIGLIAIGGAHRKLLARITL